MAAEFSVRRTATELHVRIVVKYPVIVRYLLPAFLAAVFGFVFYESVGLATLIGIVSVAIATGILALRNKPSELLANNFEFIVRGRFRRQRATTKVIPRADILGFKYKKSDFAEPFGRPRGLYAQCRFSSTCIVAYIDEKQCNKVVEAIYERFPEMRVSTPFKPS